MDTNVCSIRTYDFINTLLFHGDLLICGMINGRIKVWMLSDFSVESHSDPPPAPHIMEGHTKSIFAMAAKEDVLVTASGGQDKSLRMWDLRQRQQLHTMQYENLLKCQRLELTSTHLVAWYMSEAVIDRAFRSRGELVMWKLGSEAEDKFLAMELAHNVPFSRPLNGERVKMGDVSDEFSVVGYPTQIIVYRNEEHFSELRKIHLPENHWLYLLKVFRSMLLTVARKGSVETIHSLQDDSIDVTDIDRDEIIYRLQWKWTLFSPLKSVLPTAFGLVATNTSERAYVWHWDDLPHNFHTTRSYVDVEPSGQSNFVAQWRNRPNAAMSARGVALVNEQRSRVYLLQY
jgi:hypothetical protein